MNIKRILAVWLAAGAITCWTAAQTKNAEEKAERASQAQKDKDKEANVKITKGPIIEYASADKAVIAWSTNEPSSSLLHYGTDQNNLSQTAQAPAGGDTHRVDLKNLQANTNYFFKFESAHAEGTGTEVESQIYGFRTPASNAQAIHEQPAMTAAQLQAQGGAAATTAATTPAAASTAEVQKEPLYRLTSSSDRLYTTSASEMNQAKGKGYNFEGIAGYVATSQVSGTSPLYRLTKTSNGRMEHFYTASSSEMQSAISKLGFVSEGVIGYVPTTQLAGTVPLERLVKQSTGEYLYTTSAAEKQQAVSRDHYQDQGVACYVWQS